MEARNSSPPRKRHRAAESALARLLDIELSDFFTQHWQRAPHVSRAKATAAAHLFAQLPHWDSLLSVLRCCEETAGSSVIVLKAQHPTAKYGSPASAYLDGCSIIVNNADAAYAPLADLCAELRADLAHAFCNLYLTPPRARAVDPHADDRDVLVLQLAGSKQWRVWPDPPVVLPMPKEQVGKAGLPVPPSVMGAAPLSVTLNEGDVLYIPRGFVHEANTADISASLHATIALATHDWCWACLAEAARIDSGAEAVEAAALRLELLAREECATLGHWGWRRCAPLVLVCGQPGSDAHAAAIGEADKAGRAVGLLGEQLRQAFARKIAAHNALQDAARHERALPPVGLGPSSFVRRLRQNEVVEKEAAEASRAAASRTARADGEEGTSDSGDEGATSHGLVCREELAEALLAALASVGTEPFAVAALGNAPLLDPFGKACFAHVCGELGILIVCDARGAALQSLCGGESAVSMLSLLASTHPLSLLLQAQAALFSSEGPLRGVCSYRVLGAGRVQLRLRAGRVDGFGARSWPFIVGGPGLGDDPEVATAIGTPPRAPVAARFGAPIGMVGVDDTGFVDASFWEGLGLRPSLRAIAERAVCWLEGAHVPLVGNGENCSSGDRNGELGSSAAGGVEDEDVKEQRARWAEVEAQTFRKQQVISEFRAMRRSVARAALFAAPVAKTGDDDAQMWRAAWLSPAFRFALETKSVLEREEGFRGLAADSSVSKLADGIFVFELFTADFCQMLVDEVNFFESTTLPRRRPNTMNRLGLIVNEIGLFELMSSLLESVVAPLARVLYPHELVAQELDHHHSFVVQYSARSPGDEGLDMHHDASEVTLNVCVGGEFKDGGLRFCGQFGAPDHRHSQCVYQHKRGVAVLHLGRQRHGAEAISVGERLNLITWARSSSFRAAAAFGHVQPDGYPKSPEEGEADRACLSKANDDDYERQLQRIARSDREGLMRASRAVA